MWFLSLILFGSQAFATDLQSGLYACIQGNNDSICDQKIRVLEQNGETSLKVIYDGWCGGQGPYYYFCEENHCGDEVISFTIKDSNHYLWRNEPHSIYCEFERVDGTNK